MKHRQVHALHILVLLKNRLERALKRSGLDDELANLLLELAHILELSRARNNTRADGAAQREQRLAHLRRCELLLLVQLRAGAQKHRFKRSKLERYRSSVIVGVWGAHAGVVAISALRPTLPALGATVDRNRDMCFVAFTEGRSRERALVKAPVARGDYRQILLHELQYRVGAVGNNQVESVVQDDCAKLCPAEADSDRAAAH
mmetsp:Transcript_20243/g.42762  ORF Transcript_20243/g.42762 Transcript_20243/m.42762 type:complete len:203 (+) Transcript_20243:680-1288(+)